MWEQMPKIHQLQTDRGFLLWAGTSAQRRLLPVQCVELESLSSGLGCQPRGERLHFNTLEETTKTECDDEAAGLSTRAIVDLI